MGDGEIATGTLTSRACHATRAVIRVPTTQHFGALDVVGLTKRYGSHVAIRDASFSVQSGEILGIIGPNGAGKTTLLEAIAGILPYNDGEIRWHGTPQRRPRDVIFYLPDGVRPYGDQYVERVLAFFAGVYRRTAGELNEIVSVVELNPVRGQRVRTLSKGFARRLIWAIGSARAASRTPDGRTIRWLRSQADPRDDGPPAPHCGERAAVSFCRSISFATPNRSATGSYCSPRAAFVAPERSPICVRNQSA